MRSERESLTDILEAIEKIQERASVDRPAFDGDELAQIWVVHHLEIIGEAARKLSAETRASHPEVDWTGIMAMRNALVHGYFQIHLEEVWSVVTQDVPKLRDQVTEILQTLGEP